MNVFVSLAARLNFIHYFETKSCFTVGEFTLSDRSISLKAKMMPAMFFILSDYKGLFVPMCVKTHRTWQLYQTLCHHGYNNKNMYCVPELCCHGYSNKHIVKRLVWLCLREDVHY